MKVEVRSCWEGGGKRDGKRRRAGEERQQCCLQGKIQREGKECSQILDKFFSHIMYYVIHLLPCLILGFFIVH